MLPILPAILLLLFHGPANIERLAMEGRLPAALEAIQRMENPARESEALATLLAASRDPELTRAIFTLLHWAEPETEVRPLVAPEVDERVPIDSGEEPPPRRGFSSSQRTRDGPFSGF